jgi:isopenicillin N synthase-like dioxygenase
MGKSVLTVSLTVLNISKSAKFFALPQEIKDKAPHPPEGWWQRGYSGFGREKLSQMVFDRESIAELRKVPDVKESFDMGKENNPRMPNIWLPEEDLPGFRGFFNRFYALCNQLGLDIMRALALGMGLDEDFFVAYHQNADNQTRILHYPSVPEDLLRLGKAERIAAHSDFGTITLLFQDRVGGLEIEDPQKEGLFKPVPYIHGTVVVNVADFLKMWTNDTLKSALHRVCAPPSVESEQGEGKVVPERFSIPYFYGPDAEKTVECVPGCCGPERPKRYGPTTVGEYINMRVDALY